MAEDLVKQMKYQGIDKDGNVRIEVTAASALEYVNPDAIQAAVTNVETELDNVCSTITTSGLSDNSLKNELTEGIYINGHSMYPNVESIIEVAGTISSDAKSILEPYPEKAKEAYNKIQGDFNQAAEQAAWGEEVVRVDSTELG